MTAGLSSLIECGTKLWLDSIDPVEVAKNRALGATGATSNPIIVADLIKSGRFDDAVRGLYAQGLDAKTIAWRLTDDLVSQAEAVFRPVWEQSKGNDGYVSFELDPLLEDASCTLDLPHKIAAYVALGKEWSSGHKNRMIKVPATPAGLGALEELAAHGVTLNVTLIFSPQQAKTAREAIWRGAQKAARLDRFKSVYSIFVSRVDVYTAKVAPGLSAAAQGQVGIVNAKRIWQENRAFWAGKGTPLAQEMIFASTGTKSANDPPWKYVAALAGSDIQTNPPATNDAVAKSGQTFSRQVDQLPPAEVLQDIDRQISMQHLEDTLMSEGLAKFADPQKALYALLESKAP